MCQQPYIDCIVSNPILLTIFIIILLVIGLIVFTFFRIISINSSSGGSWDRSPGRFADYSNDDRNGMVCK